MHILKRIETIEARWAFRDSRIFRSVLAVVAIAIGVLGHAVLKSAFMEVAAGRGYAESVARFWDDKFLLLNMAFGSIYAVISYFSMSLEGGQERTAAPTFVRSSKLKLALQQGSTLTTAHRPEFVNARLSRISACRSRRQKAFECVSQRARESRLTRALL